MVEDQNAAYPIVIDPLMASFEEQFSGTQTDQRFGFAVAIDGNAAVVGAWRTDLSLGGSPYIDAGLVYLFRRNPDNSWSSPTTWTGFVNDNETCGYSVAISGSRVVYGCPGANTQKGIAFFRDFVALTVLQLDAGPRSVGDQFGYSAAVSGNTIAIGAPYWDGITQDTGVAYLFTVESGSALNWGQLGGATNTLLGTSVALDSDTLLVGAPGAGPGQVLAYKVESKSLQSQGVLLASDGELAITSARCRCQPRHGCRGRLRRRRQRNRCWSCLRLRAGPQRSLESATETQGSRLQGGRPLQSACGGHRRQHDRRGCRRMGFLS